ncbi:hypothetical protein [Brevibacillus reuszeri]|uniref:hypothetical protein n=1 Tax=Brevibacillus reuszeri TaxID=54915 RepID=UPI000CCBE394|nr:hypothetical protein [Brevibacillus reuszeri]
MAKIYEIMKEKRKRQQKPISFAKHLGRAIERYKRPTPAKPAEVMTIDQIKRLMGDTGKRQFLKDKNKARK